MNNKTLLNFFTLCILFAATTNSCDYNTNGADETYNGGPYSSFCVAYGLLAGYDVTPEMDLNNPNAAFDPVIRVMHTTCFSIFGCAIYERKLLRPGECDDTFGGASSVWATKETIGINSDGQICHNRLGRPPEQCTRQTDAICAYSSTILNCRNNLNLTGHLLKCLPIPLTPAPPPACEHVTTKLLPRLVPVAAKNGNSYFTPKIKLIMGDKFKVCQSSGINFYQAISPSEINSKQYKCTSGNFDKIIMPTAEKTYDIDPFKITNDTFSASGNVLKIVFTPQQKEICVTADDIPLGCLIRPAISDLIVTYDVSNKALIYTTNDIKQQTWSVKVSTKDEITTNKQATFDLFGASNMNTKLFAATVNADSTKTKLKQFITCPDKTLIDLLDPNAKCPTPKLINAFSCGSKTVQDTKDCPSGTTATPKQIQQCANTTVEVGQDCPFETSPDYADDGDFICLFGYRGSNFLSFDIRNRTLTPIYQGGTMFFAPADAINQGQPLNIDPFTLDQTVLDTFVQETSSIKIFPINNIAATGARYEWRQQMGATATNTQHTTFFKKSDNSPFFQDANNQIIIDPMLNNLCVANPVPKKPQNTTTP